MKFIKHSFDRFDERYIALGTVDGVLGRGA